MACENRSAHIRVFRSKQCSPGEDYTPPLIGRRLKWLMTLTWSHWQVWVSWWTCELCPEWATYCPASELCLTFILCRMKTHPFFFLPSGLPHLTPAPRRLFLSLLCRLTSDVSPLPREMNLLLDGPCLTPLLSNTLGPSVTAFKRPSIQHHLSLHAPQAPGIPLCAHINGDPC